MSKPLYLVTAVLLVAATTAQTALLLADLPAFPLISLLLTAAATLLFLFTARPASSPATTAQHARPVTDNRADSDEYDNDRETGTVKWFNTTKGFGFISRDNGDDIFVHFRAIRGEGHRILIEGQRVEYNVVSREKGLQAEDVVEVSA